jgi:splicing factor 45
MTVKGQVDEMLQPETAGECQKYGNVLECIVYEVPGDIPPEESVRIFVRFEKVEEALKGRL